MTKSSDKQIPLTTKYPIPIFLVLVSAGLAANYFNFELFFNIQLIFGSIFALLALQIFGLVPGIIAAALISSITYSIWNHPYSIIIMTAEVITVGLLYRRNGLNIVLLDTIYWLCLGMPLVYLFHYTVMGLPFDNVLIIMAKQALNGISNALVAAMTFMVFASIKRRTLFSFREIIFHLLAIFVLGPSIFILTLDSRTTFTETNLGIKNSLLHSSSRITFNLEQWLQGHMFLISHLAKMAATNSLSTLQEEVENIHAETPDFLRIGTLDKGATIVSFSPLIDELGHQNLGRNFADRPFIPIIKHTLKPILSEVVMGRINRPAPVVSMVAPIVKNGLYDGYAIGVLNLQALQKVIETETNDLTMNYTLLDKNGKIIISNRKDLEMMATFSRKPGELQRLDNGISHWVPVLRKNISISERWQKSIFLKESTVENIGGWTLILEQRVAPFQKKLSERYVYKLGLLMLILLLALTLSEIFSRQIIKSLSSLNLLTTNLPDKLLSGQDIFWPESRILETESLLANFKHMAKALSEKFHQIKELNNSLEDRIQASTQTAVQLAERYQTLMMTATDGIHIFDIQGNMIEANDSFCEMLGYSQEEVLRLNVRDWDTKYNPEEIQANIQKLFERPALFTTLHRRKDGEIRDVEISAGGVVIAGKPLIFNTSRDITERKKSEKEREQFQTFFQTSTDIMCIADPNGAFLRINPACSELLGYSEQELVSRPFIDFIHPDDKQPTIDEMARQIDCGSSLNFENRYKCKDGTYLWLSWRANYNKNEGITYATARDISERKQTEEILLRTVKEKEVMLKEIHHRVKNNMQVIYSLLNLQAKGISDSVVRTMFEESRNRISSMSLIHEKLYRSSDLSHIDFKEYLQSLISGIASTYNRHDIVFVVDMDPMQLDINIGIPLGLIVNELLSNSLKHAFPDGRKGTITLSLSKNIEGKISLSISDNGIGFPTEIDYKNTTSLGMQLVIVLTGQLNGTVELEQEAGTKFTITFPAG